MCNIKPIHTHNSKVVGETDVVFCIYVRISQSYALITKCTIFYDFKPFSFSVVLVLIIENYICERTYDIFTTAPIKSTIKLLLVLVVISNRYPKSTEYKLLGDKYVEILIICLVDKKGKT